MSKPKKINWTRHALDRKMREKGTKNGNPNAVNDFDETIEGLNTISHAKEDKPDTYYERKVALGLIKPKIKKEVI